MTRSVREKYYMYIHFSTGFRARWFIHTHTHTQIYTEKFVLRMFIPSVLKMNIILYPIKTTLVVAKKDKLPTMTLCTSLTFIIELYIFINSNNCYIIFRPIRRQFTACLCLFLFCMGVMMVTNGGAYIFQLMDFYGASGIAIIFCCFFQVRDMNFQHAHTNLN